jgi:transposase
MAAKRRKHSEEFKKDAVALTFKSDKGITEIAEDLGINRSVLARWRREFDELGNNAFPGNGLRKLSPLEEENLRLKKELADVKEERDILKKAVHIFSRKPK